MDKDIWILGISCSHNGAAALVKNGKEIVAIQEERLTRQKRQQTYGSKPMLSIQYCFDYAGINVSDLSMVVLCSPRRANDPIDDVNLNPQLNVSKYKIPTEVISHHLGHAIGAFTASGFENGAILVIDGVGSPFEDLNENEKKAVVDEVEDGWETISIYEADRHGIRPLEKHLIEQGNWLSSEIDRMKSFGSLGGMFSAVASQVFGNPLDAGKVMGLAPYGYPSFPMEDFFTIENGRFCFTNKVRDYFKTMDKWPLRQDEYQNLSASVQLALEKALNYLVSRLFQLSSSKNFCYTGGVALNSVANEKLIQEFNIKNVFIQPEAEDSGTALGAAMYGYWRLKGTFPQNKQIKSDSRGKLYSSDKINEAISMIPGISIHSNNKIIEKTVDLLCQGKIIGLFSGESELGPRALGHRSILCDPRIPNAKEILNLKVKHREAFRPFAPVILKERVQDWFETSNDEFESPFMLRVCRFKEDKMNMLPAVTHVDGTGRVQTVTEKDNGFYYLIVKEFYKRTGVPVLVNTSFNIMGEPIVETPEDALWCLLGTDIDYVTFDNCIVGKSEGSSSILDLVPYITAKRYNIHCLMENEKVNSPSLNRYSFASFVVATPWGEVKQITGASILELLEHVDGKSTGRQILSQWLKANREQNNHFDLGECVKKWESVSFGDNEKMQGFTNNASILIDDISYARMIASIVYRDNMQIHSENDLQKVLLQLKRSKIISFKS